MSNQGIALTYRPNEFNGDGHFRDWYGHHSILANVDKKRHWYKVDEYYLDVNANLLDEDLLRFINYLKSCKIDPCVELIEEYEEKYGEGSEKFL